MSDGLQLFVFIRFRLNGRMDNHLYHIYSCVVPIQNPDLTVIHTN